MFVENKHTTLVLANAPKDHSILLAFDQTNKSWWKFNRTCISDKYFLFIQHRNFKPQFLATRFQCNNMLFAAFFIVYYTTFWHSGRTMRNKPLFLLMGWWMLNNFHKKHPCTAKTATKNRAKVRVTVGKNWKSAHYNPGRVIDFKKLLYKPLPTKK